jgi:hypothetical protein
VFSVIGSSNTIISFSKSNFSSIAGISSPLDDVSPMSLGGVLFVAVASRVNISECNFSDIGGIISGGAIYVQKQADVILRSCKFENIKTTNNGGLLFIIGPEQYGLFF